MATWYFNNVKGATNWSSTNLWWSNANGTGSHPSSAPWTTSATAGDNLAPATGFSGSILLDVDLGSSSGTFTITGICSTPIACWPLNNRYIYSGNYTQAISNPYQFNLYISGGTFGGAVSGNFRKSTFISGGTFNGSVQYASITNGTFNAAVLNATGITGGNFTGSVASQNGGISAGTFNAAVTIVNANVTGGTFNSSIVGSNNVGIVNGTFNGAVSNFSYISGGNFTNATVSNVNSITGGTHPTNYTGIWVNLYYNNGALGTGFYGNRYYINGQYVSSVDSFGNGFYNSLLYIGGTSTGYAQSSVYVFNNANSTNDFTDLANYTLNGSVPTNLPSSSDIVYATIDQGLAPPWTLQGNLTASKIYINTDSSGYSVNRGTVVGDVYAIGSTALEYFSITGHLYVLQQATGWNCTATTGITYNGFSGPGTTEDNSGIYVNGEFVAFSGGWQGQYYIGTSSSCAGFIVDKDYSNGKYYFWDCQPISPEINSTSTFAVYAAGLSFVFKNGVQTSGTGVFYTYINGGTNANNLFINGSIASGGYNGYYYTATSDNPDTSFTGTAPDYYKDPTGVTQYLFVDGYMASGGWGSTHYTNGVADTFTGVDIDWSNGTTLNGNGGSGTVYVDGSQAGSGYVGYNGVLYYQTGGFTTQSGLYPDYYYDPTGVTQYCFAGGYASDPDCAGNCGGHEVYEYDSCGNYCCSNLDTSINGCNVCSGYSCEDLGCGCGQPAPIDNCHDCYGNCTCYDACGCNTEYDGCGNCVTFGTGCYNNCYYGICGCSDDYGCGCNSDGSSIAPIDNCHNCDGSCGGVNNCGDCGVGCGSDYDDCGNCNFYGDGCRSGNCDLCGNCGNYHGGCTNGNACTSDSCANYDDGSCYDGSDSCHDVCGNCTCSDCGPGCGSDYDDCGNCNFYGDGCRSGNCDLCGNCGNSHGGCTDGNACNYDSCANYDDGSCQYIDCNGVCGGCCTDNCGNCGYGNMSDDCGNWNGCCHSGCDLCGNCGNSHGGCTDSSATNYDRCANYDDGSCVYIQNQCSVQNGGCWGQHYTNSVRDTFTGIDYDQGFGSSVYYISGWSDSPITTGGWGDTHYTNGSTDQFTGIDIDSSIITHDRNTKLLLHFDGNLDDSSYYNWQFSSNGNAVTQTAVAKFSAALDVHNGGQIQATIPDNSFMFPGDFTIECYFYYTDNSTNYGTLISGNNGADFSGFLIGLVDDNQFGILATTGNPGDRNWNINILPQYDGVYNQWRHVAAVRLGSVITVYLDGNSIGSQTNYGVIVPVSNITIGGYNYWSGSTTRNTNGYISDVRITKGTALYTGNFTPQNTPLVQQNPPPAAGSNSLLLMHFDAQNGSSVFTDTANNINFNQNGGSPIISSAHSKFGGSSLLLDGSSYISTNNSGIFNFGSFNFTMEAWVWLNSYPSSNDWPSQWYNTFVVMGVGSPSAGDGFDLCLGPTEIFCQTNDVKVAAGTHNMNLNQWYHVAAVVNNNLLTVYVNGQVIQSQDISQYGNAGSGSVFSIGSETQQGAYFNGYIDEVRVSNIAVYTGDFTVPTSEFYIPVANSNLKYWELGAVAGDVTFPITLPQPGQVLNGVPYANKTGALKNVPGFNIGSLLKLPINI